MMGCHSPNHRCGASDTVAPCQSGPHIACEHAGVLRAPTRPETVGPVGTRADAQPVDSPKAKQNQQRLEIETEP